MLLQVRKYGELYAQTRLETLDCLDKLSCLDTHDDLKSKLLFSVIVVSICIGINIGIFSLSISLLVSFNLNIFSFPSAQFRAQWRPRGIRFAGFSSFPRPPPPQTQRPPRPGKWRLQSPPTSGELQTHLTSRKMSR